MQRYELSDEQWDLIEEFLPRNAGPGRPWEDHRRVLNGMFWVLHSGAPWRDMPERYGPWQTVYDRFSRWREDGTFDKMLEKLQMSSTPKDTSTGTSGVWTVATLERTRPQLVRVKRGACRRACGPRAGSLARRVGIKVPPCR